jgi:hypothetical protein
MGDETETTYDDIPCSRYKWIVYLEMKSVSVSIEADTAEEAMEIAQDNYQLKELATITATGGIMPLDNLPELESVSAQITGVTEEFAEIMDSVKNA